ncbi:RHS repeat-associated core domain-containing protein [Entomospira entomophila]|uniref:Teneurin-like YD-shell domain-containing protein n=1 Tax=Entomospira entomophila TaxID=2719988 RepID=A0A968GCR6_9SPIO|nr:RHS repeat-associated core domain-containing protein [Entomospira entomophilus]NIZ41051.1 hypothetical protein [Entomospira entomophilus]WDI35260.1 RHS repeat-associated core domain-containing protein [Entomospira entomophilus]
MWQVDVTGRNNIEYKNIYLGRDRLLTKMGNETYHNASDNSYQRINQYYNHANHIGSVNVISDYQGREFKYVEYTLYGEEWFSETSNLNSGAVGPDGLEYGFTDHLHDEETGLIYANARYLDPKTSRWMSSDPAMADYKPLSKEHKNAEEYNQNLPGAGGVFNSRNLQTYHYAGNNPIKYVDPTGESVVVGVLGFVSTATSYIPHPAARVVSITTRVAATAIAIYELSESIDHQNESSDTSDTSEIANPTAVSTVSTSGGSPQGGQDNQEDPEEKSNQLIKPRKDPYWTPNRIEHTFQGDGPDKGGHYNLQNIGKKTQFSQRQTPKQIQDLIQKAARDPNTRWSIDSRNGNLYTIKYIDGQGWVKIVTKPSGEIVTAYPVNGPPTSPAK